MMVRVRASVSEKKIFIFPMQFNRMSNDIIHSFYVVMGYFASYIFTMNVLQY